jgi:hypothetical protein
MDFGNVAYANENVVLPGFANFSFSNSVILKTKGCQNLTFEFETLDSLPRENTAMAVILYNNVSDDLIHGYTGWFSSLTYKGAPKFPVSPRIGTLKVKVCRNNWKAGTGDSRTKFLKVSPGDYRVYFRGSYMNVETIKPFNITEASSIITFKTK